MPLPSDPSGWMLAYDGPFNGQYILDGDAVPDGGIVRFRQYPNGFYIRIVDYFQWVEL